MENDAELFDARFLGRLRSLFFKLRKRRQLQKPGIHPTPAAGFTREFKDHRRYTPGDDFRAIDWRLFAAGEAVHPHLRGGAGVPRPHLARSQPLDAGPARRKTGDGFAGGHGAGLHGPGEPAPRVALEPGRRPAAQEPAAEGPGTRPRAAGAVGLAGVRRRDRPDRARSGNSATRDRRGLVFIISDLFGRAPEMFGRGPAASHALARRNPRDPRARTRTRCGRAWRAKSAW